MQIIFSDKHRLQDGKAELIDGGLQPRLELPKRADAIPNARQNAGFDDVVSPSVHGVEPTERIHKSNYIDFLANGWTLWTAEDRDHDALPLSWQVRGMRNKEPESIDGKLSYFPFDAGTPITARPCEAATSAADIAATGVDRIVAGAASVFSLCRPPGRYAAADYHEGYCFLNDAAIAAQRLRDSGADRVAILDIDYHHGSGTQSIFYGRGDVLFTSNHGDPRREYPFFLSHEDETGKDRNEICNLYFSLRWDSSSRQWFDALESAIGRISSFRSDSVVVLLGVDTFVHDPTSRFRLESTDYIEIGKRIAALRLPTLFVMEVGYAVDAVGRNVANVLNGFLNHD